MPFRTLLCLFFVTASCSFHTAAAHAQRQLAPGVLKTIEAELSVRDGFTLPMPLPDLEAAEYSLSERPLKDTLRGQTQSITLFKDVWQLEFSFLGLRQMDIDLPTPQGKVRRNVWYIVYRVKNVGKSITHRRIVDPRDGHVEHELQFDKDDLNSASLPDRFFPKFVLQGWVENESATDRRDKYRLVRYMDSLIPGAADAIQAEEDPDQPLLDSVMISRQNLVVSKEEDGGVWGVATFVDIDPNIDYVSVQVSGLTNAYRIQKTPGGEQQLLQKTLQLNFWRPGDTVDESDDVVSYGIPLVDDPREQVNITERYDLPGPIFQIYDYESSVARYELVAEASAELDADFNSTAVSGLNAGRMSEELEIALIDAGYDVGRGPRLETRVPNLVWRVNGKKNGEDRIVEIRLEPQFWEKADRGIRFIKSLDYMWIYR